MFIFKPLLNTPLPFITFIQRLPQLYSTYSNNKRNCHKINTNKKCNLKSPQYQKMSARPPLRPASAGSRRPSSTGSCFRLFSTTKRAPPPPPLSLSQAAPLVACWRNACAHRQAITRIRSNCREDKQICEYKIQ